VNEDEKDGGGGDIVPYQPKRADKPYRPRHDGFTPEKRKRFFKALKKTGCINDGCRAAGISRVTVRRWRERWEDFDRQVEAALALASVELDAIAWKRATEGTEEKVYRDGRLVFTRVKPSDAMLRLLMQGADPDKYGRTGQLPKKSLMRQLRKEAEAKVRAGLRASKSELIDALTRGLAALRKRKLVAGWSEGPGGQLVPPGHRLVAEPGAPPLPPLALPPPGEDA
jgi:transposase-like protein